MGVTASIGTHSGLTGTPTGTANLHLNPLLPSLMTVRTRKSQSWWTELCAILTMMMKFQIWKTGSSMTQMMKMMMTLQLETTQNHHSSSNHPTVCSNASINTMVNPHVSIQWIVLGMTMEL